MSEGLQERWARRLVCSKTGETAPLDAPAFVSPAGAPWLVEYDLDREKGEQLRRALPGRPWTLWRYRELLPLAHFDDRIDLGEGGTPLIRLRRFGEGRAAGAAGAAGIELWLKDEAGNPTGSFKARGLSLAVNRARELGAEGVQLPSAGNAALALCAYAAAAGLPARVAMPEDTPRVIFERCQDFGAQVFASPGTLVEAAKLLDDGAPYWNLSTLKEPYRAEGKKTMGLELAEQLGWSLPDWIVYPLGGGTGIVGMHKAFDELERLGLIGAERPRFVAVQMEGCAPIVRAWEAGAEAAAPWPDAKPTQAWGLRVPKAIGDFLVLRALRETQGRAIAVAEERLAEVAARVARQEGIRVGPEGAAALAACEDLAKAGALEAGQRVVVFQTGDPANYA